MILADRMTFLRGGIAAPAQLPAGVHVPETPVLGSIIDVPTLEFHSIRLAAIEMYVGLRYPLPRRNHVFYRRPVTVTAHIRDAHTHACFRLRKADRSCEHEHGNSNYFLHGEPPVELVSCRALPHGSP
jgi:hypothetical protein